MSKIVGVDLGTTLTKMAWEDTLDRPGEFLFATSARHSIESQIKRLKSFGYGMAIVTGINKANEKLLTPLAIVRPTGDPIENEIELQANGARKLLEISGKSDVKDFLLVSIGTGTSYTIVGANKARRFPFGNGIGGGFVSGILKLASVPLEILADPLIIQNGKSLDIQLKDVIPETWDSLRGELIISHFGKIDGCNMNHQDVVRTALNCVATTIIRDIIKLNMIFEYKPPQHIVFIGSTVARCPALQAMFENYFRILNESYLWWHHEAIFPPNAEFAGALGALLYGK